MSLAFQTVLILLLYLPGGFFVWSLTGGLSEDRDVPIPSASLTTLVVLSFTAAVLLHTLGGGALLLVDVLTPLRAQSLASDAFLFLSVANDKPPFLAASAALARNLHWLAIYLLSLIAFAVLAGARLNRLIRTRGLDVKYKALRFLPKFHYVLSSEFISRKLDRRPPVDVVVDALVDLQGGSQIYSGTVSDFWFDKQTNALEAVLLNDVIRTPVVPPGGNPANVTPGGHRGRVDGAEILGRPEPERPLREPPVGAPTGRTRRVQGSARESAKPARNSRPRSVRPTITAFADSPDEGQGLARDMRVRWALEEAGQDYDVRLVSFAEMKQPGGLHGPASLTSRGRGYPQLTDSPPASTDSRIPLRRCEPTRPAGTVEPSVFHWSRRMGTSRRTDRSPSAGTRDVTADVQKLREQKAQLPKGEPRGRGLSGETVGEEVLDRSGPEGVGSSGALGSLGSPGRYQHL